MLFLFAAAILAAILNISISPRTPEWHESDSEYVDNKVLLSSNKLWVDSNAWFIALLQD